MYVCVFWWVNVSFNPLSQSLLDWQVYMYVGTRNIYIHRTTVDSSLFHFYFLQKLKEESKNIRIDFTIRSSIFISYGIHAINMNKQNLFAHLPAYILHYSFLAVYGSYNTNNKTACSYSNIPFLICFHFLR